MTFSLYSTEIWRPGILRAPIADVLAAPAAIPIVWLPRPRDFCFLADPFGLWRDGHLHVFCESYDYRTKHGVIRFFTYDSALTLVREGEALHRDHHLSYPFLVEHAGEVYMLPEAHRAGKLTLYRARRFPDDWEPVADILDLPAIDASMVFHRGRWWMFHALPGPDRRAMRELHVAVADDLRGPWAPHPANPVHTGLAASRPAGTPFRMGEALYLPTQDCREAYGK